jgi:hypothetical protein
VNVIPKYQTCLKLIRDKWRDIIVGCSTDGARLMTGRPLGFATRLGQCTNANLIRIWFGLHQLDLFKMLVFKKALDEEFYSVLTTVIGHLCRQQNLITSMRSTCPLIADVS